MTVNKENVLHPLKCELGYYNKHGAVVLSSFNNTQGFDHESLN